MKKATSAQDVRLPVEVVELECFRNKDGSPVRVLCEPIERLLVVAIVRSLPGERVKAMREAAADPASDDPDVLLERVKVFEDYGPRLIELGSALEDGDGGQVRPAFWFGGERPPLWPETAPWPHPQSIPGRLLQFEDKALLVASVMRQSGYLGGAGAGGATFHAGVGGRRKRGLGAAPAGPSGGPVGLGDAP
jgi:hypothetical protein